jgi:hypothetical protein
MSKKDLIAIASERDGIKLFSQSRQKFVAEDLNQLPAKSNAQQSLTALAWNQSNSRKIHGDTPKAFDESSCLWGLFE